MIRFIKVITKIQIKADKENLKQKKPKPLKQFHCLSRFGKYGRGALPRARIAFQIF
jgi:hypothetical protein